MTKEQAIKLLRKDTSIDEIHKLRDNGLSHTEVTDAIQEAMDLGADAIEKQIAKKPVGEWYLLACPICNGVVYEHECNDKFDYCPNCGQKINWSEVN